MTSKSTRLLCGCVATCFLQESTVEKKKKEKIWSSSSRLILPFKAPAAEDDEDSKCAEEEEVHISLLTGQRLASASSHELKVTGTVCRRRSVLCTSHLCDTRNSSGVKGERE